MNKKIEEAKVGDTIIIYNDELLLGKPLDVSVKEKADELNCSFKIMPGLINSDGDTDSVVIKFFNRKQNV